MSHLAASTVAVLRVKWLLSADLVRDLAAVTACAPFDWSKLFIRPDLVWRTVLIAEIFFRHCRLVKRFRITKVSCVDWEAAGAEGI
jgi:hypothetical protein